MRDIGFSISPGRAVGIVGRNGSGKSTLLRLVAGVIKPDRGEIVVTGRIGALLDIGAGFTDDLTGRENVFVSGVIAGMTKKEISQRFDEIVAFAEIEDFIDHPLRTYSTGMRMRLAFSVSVNIDPDILLIDEVLAVGDAAFQRKCLARIKGMKDRGCTIFFVSHDASQVRALCDDVLFLARGRLKAFGPVSEIMPLYEAGPMPGAEQGQAETSSVVTANGVPLRLGLNRFGSLKAEIVAVRLLDPQSQSVESILTGTGLIVEMDYRNEAEVARLKASVSIYRQDGVVCYDSTTEMGGIEVPGSTEGFTLHLSIERLDLGAGSYSVYVGLFDESWTDVYDVHVQVYSLEIIGVTAGKGVLSPPSRWKLVREAWERPTPRVADGRALTRS
jgi:lipopolysaccharide transport system ATP-binding protein